MTLRRATSQDEDVARAALDAWEPGLLDRLVTPDGAVLLVADRKSGPALFLASAGLAQDVEDAGAPIHFAGLPLGAVRQGRWDPSLEGATLAAAHVRGRRVTITEGAAKAFLYGKPIRRGDVARRSGQAVPEEPVLVLGPAKEFLGTARLTQTGDLDPIQDLGWYLRHGG